mmetsp:Transcript_85569/g.277115  ORF Transcript_85569/g.277115 Transcript_85569/m.277115 type:complete len:280 (-) Transcript_85569:121-960(-)
MHGKPTAKHARQFPELVAHDDHPVVELHPPVAAAVPAQQLGAREEVPRREVRLHAAVHAHDRVREVAQHLVLGDPVGEAAVGVVQHHGVGVPVRAPPDQWPQLLVLDLLEARHKAGHRRRRVPWQAGSGLAVHVAEEVHGRADRGLRAELRAALRADPADLIEHAVKGLLVPCVLRRTPWPALPRPPPGGCAAGLAQQPRVDVGPGAEVRGHVVGVRRVARPQDLAVPPRALEVAHEGLDLGGLAGLVRGLRRSRRPLLRRRLGQAHALGPAVARLRAP